LAIDKPHEVIVRQEFNVEVDHASGLQMRREVLRNNKFPGVGGGRGCTRCFFFWYGCGGSPWPPAIGNRVLDGSASVLVQ
jgi:hypothetical protein